MNCLAKRLPNNLFFKHILRNKSNVNKQITMNSSNIVSENKLKEFFEKEFQELNDDSVIESINDIKIKDKIELIINEFVYNKNKSLEANTTITMDDIKDLLKFEIKNKQKLINCLYRKQIAKLNTPTTGLWDNQNQLMYGLHHNSLSHKMCWNSVNRLYSNRLRNSALFGQKLIIDLDFDKYMTLNECRLNVRHIYRLFKFNKYLSVEPFDLHFTNCNALEPSMQMISHYVPNYNAPEFMTTFHTESYTGIELFPKHKLVYLSPHSNQTLDTYNNDDIYIIGGFVDTSGPRHVTNVKALQEGIRTARFPIDEHVEWGKGTKCLCIANVVRILHDMKFGGNWGKALRDNLPEGKLKSVDEF